MASTLASLWRLASLAEYGSEQSAALIPFTLFAEIDIPIPDPQITIPKSVFLSITS